MFSTPTLKDVALQASVSTAIVSRVLAGAADVRVSPETRARILRAAEELNYHPNALAKGLKAQQSRTIALFIPDLGNPVLPEIVRGVEDEAVNHGYALNIIHMNERFLERKVYLTLIQESRVDGLILATARAEDSTVDDLLKFNYPFVLINRAASRTNNYVTVDDTRGSEIAVDHLIELGHRRIAHLAGPLMYDTALRRLQGYRLSLARHGLPYDAALVEESGWSTYEDGKQALARLMARTGCPTAVFAGSFVVAVGAMAFLRAAGLKIPDDVSVIGLHDAPLAEHVEPPLTVVEMPLYEMGRAAAIALIRFLNERIPIVPQTLPPVGLIVRKSTSGPRG